MQRLWKAYVFAVASSWLLAAGGATAEVEPPGHALTPPRLSLPSGDVWTWRPGDADWTPAQKNLPLTAGDRVYSAAESRFEIQVGPGAFVRGGGGTEVGIEKHKSDFLRLDVPRGTISLDARHLGIGQVIEVITAQAEFRMDRAGYYRLDVRPSMVRLTTRAGGLATVKLASGKLTVAGSGTELVVDQSPTTPVASETVSAPDDWDNWNYERSADLLDTESARYVSAEIYGLRDLDDHGDWRHVPTYGHVWVPARVPPTWAPYSAGRWIWDPYYRWTWIDDAPWGWAPFHYGRWVYLDGFWAWAPGPQYLAPVYAPALVAFFGSGPVRVGFGFSSVSWVALGWGEPLYPWWGPPYYIGRPCWRGWGGPRVVKHHPGHHKDRHGHHKDHPGHHKHRPGHRGHDGRPHEIADYDNGRVRDAVRHLPPNRFGRDRPDRSRPPGDRLRNATPLRGTLPMQPPGRSSAVRNVRTRVPPPERLRGRVEARRRVPARTDSAPPLPSAGRSGQKEEAMEAAPRSGAERRYPGGRAPTGQRPGYVEKRGRDTQRLAGTWRTAPPPPPDSRPSARAERPSSAKHATRGDRRGRAVPERVRDRAGRRAVPARQVPPPPPEGTTRSSATAERRAERRPSFEPSRERSRPNRSGANEQSVTRKSSTRSAGSWRRQRDSERSRYGSSTRNWRQHTPRHLSQNDTGGLATMNRRRSGGGSRQGSVTTRARRSSQRTHNAAGRRSRR
jgi:hypothetical protein